MSLKRPEGTLAPLAAGDNEPQNFRAVRPRLDTSELLLAEHFDTPSEHHASNRQLSSLDPPSLTQALEDDPNYDEFLLINYQPEHVLPTLPLLSQTTL